MVGTKFYTKMILNLENLWNHELLQTIVGQVTRFGWTVIVKKKKRDQNIPVWLIILLVNFDYSLFLYLGTHPLNADGIVNRTVCVVGVSGYCDKQYQIQIKACSVNEYVYYLRKAQSCNEGYCFGNFFIFELNIVSLTSI